MRTAAAALIGLVGLGACAAPPPPSACSLGALEQAVSAPDRKLLGLAAPYPGDGMLRGEDDALAGSQRLRRQVAWQAVARALAPVALAQPLPSAPATPQVPRWHTWYGKDDLTRLFHHLYAPLAADRKRARDRFADAELDDALAWNPHAVESQDGWPQARYDAYVAGLDTAPEIDGIGGIARVGYSPAAARHVLGSYREAVACAQGAAVPPAFADGPGAGPRRLVREPLDLAACASRRVGPYFVDAGAALIAHADGARVAVTNADGAEVCAADANQPCTAAGPGALWVTATAEDVVARGAITIDYAEANPTWASCLASAFPLDAAVVKADWRRVLVNPMPTYDTSAAGLARHLGHQGDLDWGAGDDTANPGPADIYTVALDAGVYRLAALHLMTKELDHWLWITLWWSTDPDGDFGADRPATITALGGPWGHYKMCVVTAFDERDPDPTGGFGADAPTLAAALARTRDAGPQSWCSNPYVEAGHGNASTNCIGCHQHGSTHLTAEAILGDPARFPALGRTPVRNNFPSDYSWALDAGDRLGRALADEVEYWDAALPAP